MRVDWKLVGYALSSVSVALLAYVAWPESEHSALRIPALVAGAILSIAGMVSRYASHRQDRAAIEFAQRKAIAAQQETEEGKNGCK